MSRVKCACSVLMLLALGTPADAQRISGRVVDENSRAPIPTAEITFLKASTVVARTGADGQGFFAVTLPGLGDYLMIIHMISYVADTTSLAVRSLQDSILPARTLRPEPVQLRPVTVDAIRADSNAIVGFARNSFVLSGTRLARLESQGASVYTALREIRGSLRLREYLIRGRKYMCVESTRRVMNFTRVEYGQCDMITVVIDGNIISGGSGQVELNEAVKFLQTINIADYESVEYLPPAQAGTRYGFEAAAHGALVFWTRGSGPHKSTTRSHR